MAEHENVPPGARRSARFRRAAVIVLCGAAVVVLVLIFSQQFDIAAERKARVDELSRGPRVEVTEADSGPTERTITMPAEVRPYQEVTIYGKVSGYLKSLVVDRGDMVKKGQLIGVIASAETDAQFVSAQADLANKHQITERVAQLFKIGASSKTDADQARTNYQVAQATMEQLATLRSYEKLLAPFDGRVTARYADTGALVQNATSSQTSALPVVTISDDTRLRVDTYVPQEDAPYVRVGGLADIVDGASPGRKLTAKISRTSGQLDSRNRTLMVEIDVVNAKGLLVGGSFAYVTLHLSTPVAPVIPVNALSSRGSKQFVAVVDKDNIVHFRDVTPGETDGSTVRIVSGLKSGERIALDIPDEVNDGSHIQAVAPSKE